MNIHSKIFLIVPFVLWSCNPKISVDGSRESIPGSWTCLTGKNDQLVIFNSCDAGNLLLSLKGNNGLLLHGGQDDAEYVIESTGNQGDTLVFSCKWKDGIEKQIFGFCWVDKSKGIARWWTLAPNDYNWEHQFVDNQHAHLFPVIDQPCKECWDDCE